MPSEIDVRGAIATRWLLYGGARGPFGRAVGAELDIPSRNGRRQTFASGEIATSPDQQMTVSVFHVRNEACFDWERTGFNYDFFRYSVAFNGEDQGQSVMKTRGVTRMWTRLQGAGEYAFTVKGCDRDDECKQDFTVPVRLQFRPVGETPDPGGHSVTGFIRNRWLELGAWDGPLGKPTTREGLKNGIRSQQFERGSITTAPEFGPEMVVAAFLRRPVNDRPVVVGPSIEVWWGGADRPFNAFRVDIYMGGRKIGEELVWLVVNNTDWARTRIGSGRLVITDPVIVGGEGAYFFFVFPVVSAHPLPTPSEFPANAVPTETAPPPGATPPVRVTFKVDDPNTHIAFPPINGTPAQAFASHASRVMDIARHFALTHPVKLFLPSSSLKDGGNAASEDDAMQLLAHLHTVLEEPDFRVPGEPLSRLLVNARLPQLKRGQTGTKIEVERVVVREGDYDMALKGLLLIAHRYRRLLTPETIDYITNELAHGLVGDHDPHVEFIDTPIAAIDIPESENHVLMIESCRFLTNRLRFERTGDQRFNNETNGLSTWLVGHLQRVAQHDFLEFNARPYGRLSVHAVLNLHEIADESSLVKTAAQIVLDYVMVKFALSSNRHRRVGPFRRLRAKTNSPTVNKELLMDDGGDPVTGFFMMYTGNLERDGKPAPWFPACWEFNALIAGLAAYRPPPAAYNLAMLPQQAAQHTFFHGVRPRLEASPEIADGGVEIYFRSPSFLLSAGGMFLNSGYGENPLDRRAQVAIPGALTLIPTQADVQFDEVIRFDPFPATLPTGNSDDDPFDDLEDGEIGVTTGVHRGFACGANLRIPDRWFTLTGALREGPWTFLDLNRDVPGGRLGFYVAAYRTLPPVDDFNPGLDNYGFLYAIEASEMSFETFIHIRERNAALPIPLSREIPLVFTTPHDPPRQFRFLIRPRGLRYLNRILHSDEDQPRRDFQTGPLVDGPWMRAANTHDGRIEIHDPSAVEGIACTTPLVLDYRDARRPRRIDNATACPQPWIDRNQALIALAGQMVNRTAQLSHDGQFAEAVEIARRAVATLRQYAPRSDDAAQYWPFFATCLWILSTHLLDAGRVDEALAPAAESVAANRTAAAIPGVDVESLARVLVTISRQLSEHARPDAAIEPMAASVDILRAPATAPGARAPITSLFAFSVMMLSVRLLEAGRDAAALPHAADAVAAFRLAAGSPDADVAALVGDLFNLSNQLSVRSRPSEAAAAVREAADILRPVVSSPDASAALHRLFAMSLKTLVERLLDAGRDADAVGAAPEAVDAFQNGADVRDANVSQLARELLNLAVQLTFHSHLDEAVDAVQAAVDMLRPLASAPDASPDTRALFAAALEALTRRLMDLGRTNDAEAPARENLRVCQRLVQEDPVRFGSQLATAQQLIASLGLE